MVAHYSDVEESPVEGAVGTNIRWLISPKSGAKNFAMRYFRVEPDGSSPKHRHPYEHEVFVVHGRGKLFLVDRSYDISQGCFSLIPENELHQFINDGDEDLEFICMIPVREDSIPPNEKKH
jgi:quercetin dioxygenase-like cupin family protein